METSISTKYQGLTIGEIVASDYNTAAVFEKFGLDFCCGGSVELSHACQKKNLDVDTVLAELESVQNDAKISAESFSEWDLEQLIDYILANHHAYINAKIPVINSFGERVINAHGAKHPEVSKIFYLFEEVRSELLSHLFKEERVLFPRIKQLERAYRRNDQLAGAAQGILSQPIRMMEVEHEGAGNIFAQIRSLSNNYQLPEDACPTFKAFYFELDAFERDLHKHIHLENNFLFPQARKLEQLFS